MSIDPADLGEALDAARALVRALERMTAGVPAAVRPDVVSPPCPLHPDQLASRCGRCAAEAVPPPARAPWRVNLTRKA